MTDLTPEFRESLRQTAEAATPGPWIAGDPQPFMPGAQVRLYDAKWNPIRLATDTERHVHPTADAKFIAAFNPTVALALLAQCEELQTALTERTAQRNDLFDAANKHLDERDALQTRIDRALAVNDSYDPGDEPFQPEEGWRFARDIRAALTSQLTNGD